MSTREQNLAHFARDNSLRLLAGPAAAALWANVIPSAMKASPIRSTRGERR